MCSNFQTRSRACLKGETDHAKNFKKLSYYHLPCDPVLVHLLIDVPEIPTYIIFNAGLECFTGCLAAVFYLEFLYIFITGK